ncbi:MAG: hypothetical protein M0C28_33635 [Candidatus Moduliflexus flocculans]|nr:hypothetical protein [Candidatus Moduliflexus flocculans]
MPTEFPSTATNDPPPTSPVNYDGRFHGRLTVRTALANSFNIPAVKALEFVGMYDDPNTPEKDGMIAMAERLGITSLTRHDYGLVADAGRRRCQPARHDRPLMPSSPTAGKRIPPVAILKIVDFAGNVSLRIPAARRRAGHPRRTRLPDLVHPFGQRRPLAACSDATPRSTCPSRLPPRPAPPTTSATTGRWATPPTSRRVCGSATPITPRWSTPPGFSGAAPIWSQFMQFAVPYVSNNNPRPFTHPAPALPKGSSAIFRARNLRNGAAAVNALNSTPATSLPCRAVKTSSPAPP